jgi:hypothetical protein
MLQCGTILHQQVRNGTDIAATHLSLLFLVLVPFLLDVLVLLLLLLLGLRNGFLLLLHALLRLQHARYEQDRHSTLAHQNGVWGGDKTDNIAE